MAGFADSEAVIWRQVEQIRKLQQGYLSLQRVLVILARRQAGVIIVGPDEMAALPSGAIAVCSERPDGSLIVRVETGERDSGPGQPGSAG